MSVLLGLLMRLEASKLYTPKTADAVGVSPKYKLEAQHSLSCTRLDTLRCPVNISYCPCVKLVSCCRVVQMMYIRPTLQAMQHHGSAVMPEVLHRLLDIVGASTRLQQPWQKHSYACSDVV